MHQGLVWVCMVVSVVEVLGLEILFEQRTLGVCVVVLGKFWSLFKATWSPLVTYIQMVVTNML